MARIRRGVSAALAAFLARQRATLSAISEDMLPCIDAMTELLAGGKRVRPAFCYWGWRAAGGADCPAIYAVAASLELLQASALTHDDVMDASETRRGRPAVHRLFAGQARLRTADQQAADQFGTGAAILVGDLLLAWTDELYRASGFGPAALARGQRTLNAMRTEVAAGQYLDILGQARRGATVAEAMRVITYKTARYTVERPLQLGAALAACSPAGAAVADDIGAGYGIPLGVAFQLRDDLLGVFGDPARTGKPVCGDISEGKRTVLLALARDRASARQLAVLDRHLGDRGLTPAGAAEVRDVLTATGAVTECEALIAANVATALGALDRAPICADAKAALAGLAVTVADRDD